MQTAHQIVADFIAAKAIDMDHFNEWFSDGGYSQDEANIHDSRYLHLLETFVEERDAERAATLPRILNKHTHSTPAGAVYIGRGSPWGNPFVIGRDGTRSEVIARYDAWIAAAPARPPARVALPRPALLLLS